MQVKSRPVTVKAAGKADGLGAGQFRALVSVFDVKDSVGDIVRKGAFTKTLEDWASSGLPVPVLWSHRMDDPDYNLGKCLELAETDDGLEVVAELDVEGNPKAAQVHRLLQQKRVTQFSFAYDVIAGAEGKSEEDGEYYELNELKLYEVGPTPIGANQATELLDVKSDPDWAARFDRLQRKYDTLKAQIDAFTKSNTPASVEVHQVPNPRGLDVINLGL